jgi:enoyl-CoA hydratase/carnithine racemase
MTRIRIDRTDDGVHAVWLDRPEKRNALDADSVSELIAAFADDSARAFVLASSDPRSFCAGADLTLPDAERAEVSDRLYELYGHMVGTRAPIVAVVDGPAVGGGAQLAIAADLRVAGPQASFRFAGPGHGLAVGSWALPSLVGRGRATDLCLTMRPVGVEEALAIGLVDRLDDDPAEAALALAAGISMLDGDAAARVKRVVTEAGGLLAALERERSENRAAWSGSVEGL